MANKKRVSGHYYVKTTYSDLFTIAYSYGDFWDFNGRNVDDTEFTHISPTPITPEKMAAIDEIITCRDGKYTLDSMVNDILDKYKLL